VWRSLKLVAPADGHHIEADLAEGITVEDHTTIKDERRLFHRVIHGAPVDVSELFPFSRDDDRFTVLRGRERCFGDRDLLLD
jgi:hypothetical protein